MNVNNLLEGASPYQVQQNEAAKLSSKWEKSGLLEGIESSTEANNMSMLLENQAKQLVNEANATGTGVSITNGGNSEAWAGVALPLVRRVFGEIVAKDLVSVQPMNLPAGLIFYLDFQYGTNEGIQQGGEKSVNDSLYGASGDLRKTELPAAGATKGLYGAGTYGYSTLNVTSSTIYVSGAAANDADITFTHNEASGTFGVLTVNDSASVDMDTEFIATLSNGLADVDEFKISTSSIPGFDEEAVRSFTVSGSAITSNFNQFTSFDAATGTVRLYAEKIFFGLS